MLSYKTEVASQHKHTYGHYSKCKQLDRVLFNRKQTAEVRTEHRNCHLQIINAYSSPNLLYSSILIRGLLARGTICSTFLPCLNWPSFEMTPLALTPSLFAFETPDLDHFDASCLESVPSRFIILERRQTSHIQDVAK